MADQPAEKMKISSALTENLITTYRQTVKTYYERHLYDSAQFWAEKLVVLSGGAAQDVYWLAQSLFQLRQFHRASHAVLSRGAHKVCRQCHYLAARSLLEAGEVDDALSLLESDDTETSFFATTCSSSTAPQPHPPDDTPDLQSAVLLLRAQALQASGNRVRAADCYRAALTADVRCHEAFSTLVQHQMLTAAEEKELISQLPFTVQLGAEEAELVRALYVSQLKKYAEPAPDPADAQQSQQKGDQTPTTAPTTQPESPELTTLQKNSLDCRAWRAERLYYNCDYHRCLEITNKVLTEDPFHSATLPVHIGCLVQFTKSNELFHLSHRLVKLYPERAVAWYAVGCYYFVISKSDPARRYLSKATQLDPLFGPAWLAYGHSFASENEHDQAMAAYFRASQLMRGCHLPLLYVGLECGLTNNVKLAEKFFAQAQSIAPCDPHVMHEMGVIAFHNEDYVEAKKQFSVALALVRAVDSRRLEEKWEPLLNNLGHACRKLGQYQEALSFHQQALSLRPLSASTYSALGLTQLLLGQSSEAVASLHEALGLRHDDSFTTALLGFAMEAMLATDTEPFAGAAPELPSFQSEFAGKEPAEEPEAEEDECDMRDDSNP